MPEAIIVSKITQSSSPASLRSLDLYGHGSSCAAVYRVVPSCSCYRCVDLSCGRDPAQHIMLLSFRFSGVLSP